MKSTSVSLQAFGIYLILIPGFGLMCCPDTLLELFQLEHGNLLWMGRMIGYLSFSLGVYYYFIAKYALSALYRLTVILRFGAALFMLGLWIAGEAKPMILGFAATDALAALWTLSTLSFVKAEQ